MFRALPVMVCAFLTFLTTGFDASAWQGTYTTYLRSNVRTPKVPLAESPHGVVRFTLVVKANEKGEGPAELILDPNSRQFDEFGEAKDVTTHSHIKLQCNLKFVKRGIVGGPDPNRDRYLYAIEGDKITSRLFLVAPSPRLDLARLLIQDRSGKTDYMILMYPPPALLPCHPGCFPAGTPVQTPKGARSIEKLRPGDLVTAVRPDGTTAAIKVKSIFVTQHRLLKLQTEEGELITTQTQPLWLGGDSTRPAGELTRGDRIFRWQDGKRQAVRVRGVVTTEREEKVFNLVLGGPEMFIAGGFVVRSKPPATKGGR